jgi:hypothetical protein
MRTSVHFVGRQAPGSSLSESSLQPIAAGAAITLYAAWNARHLLGAWLHSPFDRCDSLAFVLWIVPVLCLWVTRRLKKRPGRVACGAFAIALLISFAGVATDLSVLEYIAFAIALAGFLPVQRATVVWLACAPAWMPAAGWAMSSNGPFSVNATRAGIGLLAVLLTPLFLRHESLR